MKASLTLLGVAAFVAALAQFGGGNLVVSQVISGTGLAPTSVATQVRLIAYFRSNGRPVVPTGQIYDLPTAVSGSNKRLTLSGSATSEGQLSISTDDKYLLIGGYDADLGTAGVSTTASATVNRVVGRIDWTQPAATAIDTTTSLSNAYTGSSFRGVVSPDGSTFYLSGNGGAVNGAVSICTLGASSATLDWGGTTTRNGRNLRLFNGDVYLSAATSGGPLYGVGLVNSGVTTELSGFPTSSGPSSYNFYFLDPETMYVADDRTAANGGGIQKWHKVGGNWELAYTMQIPNVSDTGFVGARGLCGTPFFDEDEATTFAQLYAVTTDNQIVTVTDDQPGALFEHIDVGTVDKVFRGCEIIPPTVVTVSGLAIQPNAVNYQIPVDIEFRPSNGGANFSRTVTVDPADVYTVTNVPAGTGYVIHVKGFNTLAANHEVNTYSEDDLDADVELPGGDTDNDNTVSDSDLINLIIDFGGAGGSSSGFPGTDADNDGTVADGDLIVLILNFGLVGEP